MRRFYLDENYGVIEVERGKRGPHLVEYHGLREGESRPYLFNLISRWTGRCPVEDMKTLRIACAEVVGENLYLECVHIRLFRKSRTEFFNQVWGNFLKHHEEFFKRFYAGLTPGMSYRSKGGDTSTVEERRQERQLIDLRKVLFNDCLDVCYCSVCRNFQIRNRCPKAVNKCWYCKEHGRGGLQATRERDKQFFASLSLLGGSMRGYSCGHQPS